MEKIIVIRPGALGDVVVSRVVPGALRQAWPCAEIVLAAPASSGKLLVAPRLADSVFDITSAAASWLFSDGAGAPPETLRDSLGNADLAIAYMNDGDGKIRRNLEAIGCREILFHPPRPAENGNIHICQHLMSPLAERFGIELPASIPQIENSQEVIENTLSRFGLHAGKFAVIHPGSGGKRKNWPADRYRTLAQWLSKRLPVVVTSGEADGELGRRVADGIGGVINADSLRLSELCSLLSGARLYIGNDSGVSHLAAACRPLAGRDCLALFGPTRPEVWLPEGFFALKSPGGNMESIDAEAVMGKFRKFLST